METLQTGFFSAALSALSGGSATSNTSEASSRADTLPDKEDGEGEESSHALNHSLLSSFLYTWLHLLVALSIFYTNAAIAVIYEEESEVVEAVGVGVTVLLTMRLFIPLVT